MRLLQFDSLERGHKFRALCRAGKIGSTMRLGPEEKLAARTAIAANEIPRFLSFIDKRVAASSTGYIAHVTTAGTGAGGLSVADLAVFGLIGWLKSGVIDHIPSSCVDAFPSLLALREKVAALPEVVELEESYKSKA